MKIPAEILTQTMSVLEQSGRTAYGESLESSPETGIACLYTTKWMRIQTLNGYELEKTGLVITADDPAVAVNDRIVVNSPDSLNLRVVAVHPVHLLGDLHHYEIEVANADQ